MNLPQSFQMLQTFDRIISEMNTLRAQVSRLESTKKAHSVRQSEYFGMWATRDDMPEESSRAWLEHWRSQQWNRL